MLARSQKPKGTDHAEPDHRVGLTGSEAVKFSPDIEAAIASVDAAERLSVPGRDPGSTIELLKLALAEAVLAHARRVQRLPKRAQPIGADAPSAGASRRRA